MPQHSVLGGGVLVMSLIADHMCMLGYPTLLFADNVRVFSHIGTKHILLGIFLLSRPATGA